MSVQSIARTFAFVFSTFFESNVFPWMSETPCAFDNATSIKQHKITTEQRERDSIFIHIDEHDDKYNEESIKWQFTLFIEANKNRRPVQFCETFRALPRTKCVRDV